MPKVVRQGDICTGHGCWPPRPSVSGSPNVFVNGRPVVRVTDGWAAHTCPTIPETHASTQATGSATVFANGLPVARVGDSIACGSSNAQGSPNVFAG